MILVIFIYSDKDIIDALEKATSYRQILFQLGLSDSPTHYRVLQDRLLQLGVEVDQIFVSNRIKYPQKIVYKKQFNLTDILVENSTYTSLSRLKKRLLKAGIFERKCYRCGLLQWNEEAIPLALHHKNGNHMDHRLENIELVCNNCHSQFHNRKKLSKTIRKEISLQDILLKFCHSTDTLKKKLIAEGFLNSNCAVCGIGQSYNGCLLILRLDHINGNHKDNRIENLRIICPNCDALSPTFCGRNKTGKAYYRYFNCKNCGEQYKKNRAFCSQKCHYEHRNKYPEQHGVYETLSPSRKPRHLCLSFAMFHGKAG